VKIIAGCYCCYCSLAKGPAPCGVLQPTERALSLPITAAGVSVG